MLIKEIINGISQKIYSFYEGLYDIYVEDVEQGLEVPCFMINLISSNIRMILKPRYMFESVFDVIYFGEGYKDCMDRGSELYDILEYITINGFKRKEGFKRKGSVDPSIDPNDKDLIRGTKMNMDIIKNILHFRVRYNLILQNKPDIIDMMEEHQINIGVGNRWA